MGWAKWYKHTSTPIPDIYINERKPQITHTIWRFRRINYTKTINNKFREQKKKLN